MATTELPLSTDPDCEILRRLSSMSLYPPRLRQMAKSKYKLRWPKGPLSPEMLDKMNRYWRAANYLCIGQIYLFENPLLREPLKAEQIKPRLLGHWGTSPGQNLIYIHLNRLIKEHDADIIYISGPGHGGPSLNACSYLEGSYTEVHPEITADEDGMRLMFRKFSTPGGVPSHCGPHVPELHA
jgi:xylulose-5-phosphate/fructose-6-phosphate phosphoketolase